MSICLNLYKCGHTMCYNIELSAIIKHWPVKSGRIIKCEKKRIWIKLTLKSFTSHGSKKKLFSLMVFKKMFSNAAKKRKRNFNLLRSIQRNQTFRQKIISFFYFKHTCMFLQTLPKQRIIWMHEREERWFDAMWENRHSPDFQLQWKQDFRMNGFNFEKLVKEVRHALEKQDTNMRKAIRVEKRVAIAVWRLSTGISFRSVAKTFAIGKSTAVKITREFGKEFDRTASAFIKFPRNPLETAKAIQSFKQNCHCTIPQALGAIDGTHIFIKTPENERKHDYFCRKQSHSVNTQAVVGGNLIFLDVSTGFPGIMHDSRVLRNFYFSEQNN